MKLSNRTALQKADLSLAALIAGGGYLKPVVAKKFIRLLMMQSKMLQMVTAVPMAAPEQQFPKIKMADQVLQPEPVSGALTDAQRPLPEISSVALLAKPFKAEVRLPDAVLEDNIEEGELRQTIMELLTQAVARDMERVAILGDRTSPNPLLAQLDGILVQASSHIVDAGGSPLTKDLLTDLLKSLPSEYSSVRDQMRYFTSVDAELDYRRALADRETAVGDRYLETAAPVLVAGVPLIPIPMFPQNLGPGANQTVALLTHPKNIYLGIRRQVKIETDRDISRGETIIVARLAFDVRFSDELGCAKAINISL